MSHVVKCDVEGRRDIECRGVAASSRRSGHSVENGHSRGECDSEDE
jgi:hypothetical protein